MLNVSMIADEDRFDENEQQRADCVLLIKLDGRGDDFLCGTFRGAINLASKTVKYHVGFLFNYGYFYRHASPICNDDPGQHSYLRSGVQLVRQDVEAARLRDDRRDMSWILLYGKKLTAIKNVTRQYIRDFTSYCHKHEPKTAAENRGGADV